MSYLRKLSSLLGVAVVASACSSDPIAGPDGAPHPLAALTCTGNINSTALTCSADNFGNTFSRQANFIGGNGSGIRQAVIGGQNTNVRLTSSNVSYDSGTELFEFDVTVQNLLNEALGSINGIVPDTAGVKVFFHQRPIATSGSGTITIMNNDGEETFTSTNQPYYKYAGILEKNEITATRRWSFHIPATAPTFSFTVYVATIPQALLVINEMFVNPGGTISDANGEWFEIYNAGSLSVDMNGFLIADSAASGRRPYHLISNSLIVPPGGYVVLGNTANTVNNGGAPVDYAYGVFLTFANSLDALKISHVQGGDTLTIDETRYASASVSAQNGISRELINPALANGNLDGSNWADALVTAVFGPAGRGTPKAQNSRYTP